MKWYNVEVAYNTRESIKRTENFKIWLMENNYKFEASGVGDMVHFEILAHPDDLRKINNALDKIVWFDSIY